MAYLHSDREQFRDAIDLAYEQTGVMVQAIEKDYYVTMLLRLLAQKMPYIVFKGGTSLSKCHKVIRRFSEDIDITIDTLLSQGQKKKIKQAIVDSAQELGMTIENLDETRSRRDYNRYVIAYDSVIPMASDALKAAVLLETSYTAVSFPTVLLPVHYDMHMDIAAAVVTVHVGADQRLMPRKVGFYIFHADGLRLFTCQSTLVFVGRIEADEVVVRLDFVVILILVVLRIKHFALHIKKFWLTVYALQKNISAEYPVPVCIQQGFLQNFVMLIFQIVECRAIVCTFTRDVF